MRLNEILTGDLIFIEERKLSKKAVLDQLIDSIALKTGNDKMTISAAVYDRENKISTGIGFGIAVPHGRIKGWGKTTLAVLNAKKDVWYEALDGEPVHLIFMFISDADNPFEHVNILAKLSYIVSEANNMTRLRGAPTTGELYSSLLEMEKLLK